MDGGEAADVGAETTLASPKTDSANRRSSASSVEEEERPNVNFGDDIFTDAHKHDDIPRDLERWMTEVVTVSVRDLVAKMKEDQSTIMLRLEDLRQAIGRIETGFVNPEAKVTQLELQQTLKLPLLETMETNEPSQEAKDKGSQGFVPLKKAQSLVEQELLQLQSSAGTEDGEPSPLPRPRRTSTTTSEPPRKAGSRLQARHFRYLARAQRSRQSRDDGNEDDAESARSRGASSSSSGPVPPPHFWPRPVTVEVLTHGHLHSSSVFEESSDLVFTNKRRMAGTTSSDSGGAATAAAALPLSEASSANIEEAAAALARMSPPTNGGGYGYGGAAELITPPGEMEEDLAPLQTDMSGNAMYESHGEHSRPNSYVPADPITLASPDETMSNISLDGPGAPNLEQDPADLSCSQVAPGTRIIRPEHPQLADSDHNGPALGSPTVSGLPPFIEDIQESTKESEAVCKASSKALCPATLVPRFQRVSPPTTAPPPLMLGRPMGVGMELPLEGVEGGPARLTFSRASWEEQERVSNNSRNTWMSMGPKIVSLDGLDDMVTNRLFTAAGLDGDRRSFGPRQSFNNRPSFTNRPSFGQAAQAATERVSGWSAKAAFHSTFSTGQRNSHNKRTAAAQQKASAASSHNNPGPGKGSLADMGPTAAAAAVGGGGGGAAGGAVAAAAVARGAVGVVTVPGPTIPDLPSPNTGSSSGGGDGGGTAGGGGAAGGGVVKGVINGISSAAAAAFDLASASVGSQSSEATHSSRSSKIFPAAEASSILPGDSPNYCAAAAAAADDSDGDAEPATPSAAVAAAAVAAAAMAASSPKSAASSLTLSPQRKPGQVSEDSSFCVDLDMKAAESDMKGSMSQKAMRNRRADIVMLDGDGAEDERKAKGPRTSQTMSSSISGMDALRAEHEHALVMRQAFCMVAEDTTEGGTQSEYPELSFMERLMHGFPVFLLCIYGVLPVSDGPGGLLYGRFVIFIMACLLMGSMGQAVQNSGDALYSHLANSCYCLGSLLGLLFLRLQRIQDLLGPRGMPLELYSISFNFRAPWHFTSRRRFVVVAVLWGISVLSQVISLTFYRCASWGAPDLMSLVIFTLALSMMSVLLYCQLHVCCGLELAIDQFCIRFFANANLHGGVSEWNVLQALLRRAAFTTEACFLAVGTSLLAVLLLTGVELYNLGDNYGELNLDTVPCLALWSGWVLPPTALVFYTVFRAAAITEKCNRVPALVNSWLVAEDDNMQIDHNKHYAVQFIIHSAAGFYVKGVRLNATWALKLSYLFGVLVFTCITQSVLKSG